MKHNDLINYLRLIRTPSVGPITCRLLLKRYSSVSETVRAVPELSARGGRKIKLFSRDDANREIEAVERAGAAFICFAQEGYPDSLGQFDDAPFVLTVKGHKSLLSKQGCAVIGARNASINAVKYTCQLAAEIGRSGYVITSSLARGIDSAAHTGGLETGTIAVLANGIDEVYPPENKDLFERIAAQGLLVTEMAMGTKPTPRLFPQRNRIIASLSKAVLVIEAALRSGSLITAREVAERGIDVMALPGSPCDPRAPGPTGLIRDGAVLVQNAEDILTVLSQPAIVRTPTDDSFESLPDTSTAISEKDYADIRQNVLENLGADPIAVDELCR